MFNTTNISLKGGNQNVHLHNPCSGILQRSHDNSNFLRFQVNSEMESTVFPKNGTRPYITKYYSGERQMIYIIVLQILLFGDNYFLVEYVEDK